METTEPWKPKTYPISPETTEEAIREAMIGRYMLKPGVERKEAEMLAEATWFTDWTSLEDGPRTIAQGIEQVEGELEYWGEE